MEARSMTTDLTTTLPFLAESLAFRDMDEDDDAGLDDLDDLDDAEDDDFDDEFDDEDDEFDDEEFDDEDELDGIDDELSSEDGDTE
jgi:hypothetical protein